MRPRSTDGKISTIICNLQTNKQLQCIIIWNIFGKVCIPSCQLPKQIQSFSFGLPKYCWCDSNYTECFPFGDKFWFKFTDISIGEWSSIFKKNKKQKVTETSVPFDIPPGISHFRLNGSLFGNSTISRFSGNPSRKCPHHFFPFQIFQNFRLNGILTQQFIFHKI